MFTNASTASANKFYRCNSCRIVWKGDLRLTTKSNKGKLSENSHLVVKTLNISIKTVKSL